MPHQRARRLAGQRFAFGGNRGFTLAQVKDERPYGTSAFAAAIIMVEEQTFDIRIAININLDHFADRRPVCRQKFFEVKGHIIIPQAKTASEEQGEDEQ